MQVYDKIIAKNQYNRPGTLQIPLRICIHNTGSPGSGADITAKYYANVASGMFVENGESVWTSTQYIVGIEGKIIRIIPDNEIAYAAANNNSGTIHVEVCHEDSTGKFSEKAISSLSELVPELMKKYGISEENVLRHYDLTGKLCPLYYIDESRWNTLKNRIDKPNPTIYRVQVGAFLSKDYAEDYAQKMNDLGFDAFVVEG